MNIFPGHYFENIPRFTPEGVAEISEIHRDTHILPNDLTTRNTTAVAGGKPIDVRLQSISSVSAVNPLVAFYDIHGRKGVGLFYSFVRYITRDNLINKTIYLQIWKTLLVSFYEEKVLLLLLYYCFMRYILETHIQDYLISTCKAYIVYT
jgi:hypothetical protein